MAICTSCFNTENLALASLTLVPTKQLAKKKKKRLINTKSNVFYFMLKLLIRPNFPGKNLRYENGLMCLCIERESSNWIRIHIKTFSPFYLK